MYDDLTRRLRNAAIVHAGIAALMPHSDGSATVKLFEEAADAIEELSRAQEKWIVQERNALLKSVPRWIPVTERLPEDDVAVLVTYIGFLSGKPQANMLAFRSGGVWWWLDDWLDERPTSHIECAAPITHWMPLPDPPKGVE